MIDKYHPPVCIGGHMHEHFTKCKVGRTTAIIAGVGWYLVSMKLCCVPKISRQRLQKRYKESDFDGIA